MTFRRTRCAQCPRTTGWPPQPLMQDDCPELSRWIASRIDAMWTLRTRVYE